jgi:Arc/MetJ-type ribon-helix-helix transcriptional regulator
MDIALSPQTEQFLASVVADGLFASKEAALEAAVAALREKTEPIPFVPDEHMARVEASIEEANAGRTKPMTPEFWEGLRQRILDIAAAKATES